MDSSKGFVTVPAESGKEQEVIQLIQQWGADAIRDSDGTTLSEEYLNLDLQELKNKMKTPIIIDGRNIYQKEQCEKLGFIFKGVGKPR